MTPGERAASRAIRATRNDTEKAREYWRDRDAFAWITRYRHTVLNLGGGRICKVADLCVNDNHPGGWTDHGVWWNDSAGSTHVRAWLDVAGDLRR